MKDEEGHCPGARHGDVSGHARSLRHLMWSLQKYHQLKLSRQTRSPRAEGTCAKGEDPWKDTDAESSPGANGGGLGTTAQRH